MMTDDSRYGRFSQRTVQETARHGTHGRRRRRKMYKRTVCQWFVLSQQPSQWRMCFDWERFLFDFGPGWPSKKKREEPRVIETNCKRLAGLLYSFFLFGKRSCSSSKKEQVARRVLLGLHLRRRTSSTLGAAEWPAHTRIGFQLETANGN